MYLPESAKCPTISEKMGVILYLDNASEKDKSESNENKEQHAKRKLLNEEVKVFHKKNVITI